MKRSMSFPVRRAVVAAACGVVQISTVALAANGTWGGPTAVDADFANPANWVGGVVPGAGNVNNDLATFNTPINATTLIGSASNPILPDVFGGTTTRTLGGILFDTGAGAYTFGVLGGQPLGITTTLTTASPTAPRSIVMNAGVAEAQTFNAPVRLRLGSSANGAVSLTNNATTASAVLTFAQLISEAAGTRPIVITLDGSNTGNNTIANFTDNGTAGATQIIKNGVGTWILSGANSIQQQTDVSVVAGAIVNAGTLALQNSGSLGSLTQGNIVATGTGTLRLDAINLQNNGVTLNGTGTVLANGTSSVNAVAVTAGSTSVNLATVNAADVFTVNGALSGAAPTATLNILGPGQVNLTGAGSYTGITNIDGAATLRVSNATGLGAANAANVRFGATSTGVLQLNNVNATVVGLQGTAAGTAVESASGATTLTINNANANQYGGSLRDGAGQIALTKGAAGVLALTGNSTFTGNVTVTNGQLLANNTSGSATGLNNTVTTTGNGVLGGSGTVAGNAVISGRIAPGAAAGSIGTLTVGGLTLNGGSQLDYDITSPAALDRIVVTGSDGLVINGGQFNLNGGTSFFDTNGVYNLIGYTGTIGGSGVGALTLNNSNKNFATSVYTFGAAGGFVTLTVAGSGNTVSYYNTNADSTWSSPAAWTPVEPNAVGAFASFGGGGTPITANRTITVDAPKTVGTIAFNQPNGFSYTIAGPNAITLNGGSGVPAFISSTAGNHFISAPLNLLANGTTINVTPAANTLTISGAVSGAGASVTKLGAGTVALTGVNTYDGGTTLGSGTIQINSADSLGASTGGLDFAGGTLQLLADVATTRNYSTNFNDADVRINTNGFNLTQNGNIVAGAGALGGLVKTGGGTLKLAGVNTYVGTTSITAGALSISSDTSLGDTAVNAGVSLSGNTTLAATGTFATPRAITIGTGGVTFDVADTQTFTANGPVTGATVTKVNTGTLAMSNAGSTSPINVTAGTLQGNLGASFSSPLGNGQITLQNGTTLVGVGNGGNAFVLANAVNVPAGASVNINPSGRFSFNGAFTGSGTINVSLNNSPTATAAASGITINNNNTGFTGVTNFTGTGFAYFFFNGGALGGFTNSFANSTINLSDSVVLGASGNTGGNNLQIGAISGTSTSAGFGNPSQGGAPQFVVGSLNTSTTFAGYIGAASSFTKVGSGTLTLTGNNTYSGGNQIVSGAPVIGTTAGTLISGGTLAINGVGAIGSGLNPNTNLLPPLTINGGTLQFTSVLDNAANPSGDVTATRIVAVGPAGGTIDTNGNTITFSGPISNPIYTPYTGTGPAAGSTGNFIKAGAGTLILQAASTFTGTATVNAGTLRLNEVASQPLLTTTAPIFDIRNGALSVEYISTSPAATIRGLLAASYADAATPGVMDSGQLRSSTATLTRGLGYKDDGTGLVTIKATLFGDADLDGGVSINDFNALSANFGQSTGKVWVDGDFDYDGGVSINDFNLLAGGFGQSLPPTSEAWAGLLAFAAAHNDLAAFEAVTGVPEPTSLALLTAGVMFGLRRRRVG